VHNHAVVWIDHRVAKVFSLGLHAVGGRTIHADLATPHLHHKANTIGSGKVEDDLAADVLRVVQPPCVKAEIIEK